MTEIPNEISLDELVAQLDQVDVVSDPHKTSGAFQRIRDLAKKQESESQFEIAQLELEAFSFVLKDGEASHQWEFTLKDGSPDRFPNIERYSSANLDYFQKRFTETKNPHLKLRYAQLLWTSARKNLTYAKSAVDTSIEILALQLKQLDQQSDLPHDLTFFPLAKNAFHLSKYIKYRHNEICEQIQIAVHDSSDAGDSERIYVRLLSLMIAEQRSFKADSFKDLDERCLKYAESSLNPHEAIDFLKLGETVSRKLGRHSSRWQLGIGQQYEVLLQNAEERNDLTMPDFCLSAIEAYKLAGNIEKVAELNKRFDILKTKPTLSSSSVPIDEDAFNEHVETCKRRADLLLGHTPNRVLAFLTIDKSIIPDITRLRASVEEQRKSQYLFGHVPSQTLDSRGHVAKHWVEEVELAEFNLWFNYQFELKFDKGIQIATIVFEGIRRGVISVASVTEFLKDSWMGQPLKEKIGKHEVVYYWRDQFMPALELYFSEVQKTVGDANYRPEVMLAIDSLVMKFEGILRDLLFRAKQIPTFKVKLDGKKRKIVRARDIIEILNEASLSQVLTEDEIYFLKYILVEHAGWNLRGEIAHGLMLKDFYSENQMHLLFVALLKLSRFQITTVDEAETTLVESEEGEPAPENTNQE